MNPDTNRFEPLHSGETAEQQDARLKRMLVEAAEHAFPTAPMLLRPNGEPVPKTWTQFVVGELVEIKGYTFKVAWIGETAILFEPVGPVLVGSAP